MTLILGERYRKRLEPALSAMGIDVFWLFDNPDIDPRLAGHADLSVFVPDRRTVVVAGGLYPHIVNSLTNRGLAAVPSGRQGEKYPLDAGLCICATGKYTIYNEKTVDPAAAQFLSGTLIRVPQGYAKCSVCVVSNDVIITADDAIASRAVNYNIDVLKIHPGHIILEGFDHGFIGGASFLLSSDTIAFTGSLGAHPDREAILTFLGKHGVRPVFLTEEPIFDIGGAAALP